MDLIEIRAQKYGKRLLSLYIKIYQNNFKHEKISEFIHYFSTRIPVFHFLPEDQLRRSLEREGHQNDQRYFRRLYDDFRHLELPDRSLRRRNRQQRHPPTVEDVWMDGKSKRQILGRRRIHQRPLPLRGPFAQVAERAGTGHHIQT